MLEFDEIAIATSPPGATNNCISRGINRGCIGTRNIDTRMHRSTATKGIGANAEIACERQALDRAHRRDRDNSGLQLIKPLPAIEQCTELRIGLSVLDLQDLCAGGNGFIRPANPSHAGIAKTCGGKTKTCDHPGGLSVTGFGRCAHDRCHCDLIMLDSTEGGCNLSIHRTRIGGEHGGKLCRIAFALEHRGEKRLTCFKPRRMLLCGDANGGDFGLKRFDAVFHHGHFGLARSEAGNRARHRRRTQGELHDAESGYGKGHESSESKNNLRAARNMNAAHRASIMHE